MLLKVLGNFLNNVEKGGVSIFDKIVGLLRELRWKENVIDNPLEVIVVVCEN